MTQNPKGKPEDKPQEHSHKHLPDPTDCPQCGAELKRSNFRTGSVQHPGRDMLVCTRCGTRK